MSRVEPILAALMRHGIPADRARTPCPNEVHCEVPAAGLAPLADIVCGELGAELILVTADDRRDAAGAFFVHYLFAHRGQNWLVHASAPLDPQTPSVPSLAQYHYPASRFERELRDMFGIAIPGHPHPTILVKHAFWPEGWFPLRKDAVTPDFHDEGQPFPFTEVGGEGVYEIPVGPVHAGVIEPGHFRFSVMGETVINLRTRLYFTHKGTEKLFEGRLPGEGVALAERVSGDTSVGHALAFCQAVESGSGAIVPARARLLRCILLELERIYNHVADVGAIANDTGFAVAHAHCGRIRERLLRLNKQLTGSRLLRGTLAVGGLSRDLAIPSGFVANVAAAIADFDEVASICLANTLLLDRLQGTGELRTEHAADHGVLGYVARASGLDLDARRDHPFAAYDELSFDVPVRTAGDVKARTEVRLDEVHASLRLIEQACRRLDPGDVRVAVGATSPYSAAFGIVEGWRGRIVHWLMTGQDGRLHRVKILDPSFFNWPALSYALEGNIVPDFPLCNKSFNQSYSGNDL